VLIAIFFSNGVLFFNIAAIVALCGFLRTTDFRSRNKTRTQPAGQIVESVRR
jgi:hypothetical protein